MLGQKTSFARHPTLHYSLLMALGVFGIYVSMPVFYHPQSTIEWIDLAINIVIFIPSTFIAVASGLLAILSGVFSYHLDEKGRFAKFAHTVLKAFGMPGLLLPEFVVLSPLGLLIAIFTGKYSEPSISETSAPQADRDTRQ